MVDTFPEGACLLQWLSAPSHAEFLCHLLPPWPTPGRTGPSLLGRSHRGYTRESEEGTSSSCRCKSLCFQSCPIWISLLPICTYHLGTHSPHPGPSQWPPCEPCYPLVLHLLSHSHLSSHVGTLDRVPCALALTFAPLIFSDLCVMCPRPCPLTMFNSHLCSSCVRTLLDICCSPPWQATLLLTQLQGQPSTGMS